MQSFYSFLKNRRNSETGSVTILFGIMLLIVMMVAGLAVDTSRYYNASSRLQAALDASALAGAKLLTDQTKTDADIRRMTRAHFRSTIRGSGVKIVQRTRLDVAIDRLASTVTTSNTVTIRSLFGRIAGERGLVDITRSSQVIYKTQKLELSMVLDLTGSMGQRGKMNDLKAAAKDVVQILYRDAATDDEVRIAMAPYAASVNAGAYAGAVTSTASTQWCTRRSTVTCVAISYDADPCVVERTGTNATTDAAPTGLDALPNVPSNEYYNSFDRSRNPDGHYSCLSSPIAPLVGKSKQADLEAAIDAFRPDGYTAGHIGTAWGWYLISPEWKNIFTGEHAPQPYDDDKTAKAMIIMTDGLFNTEYTSGATPNDSVMVEKSYARFQSLCDGAKAKNIQIYTVYLAVGEHDDRAAAELGSCASGADHFFDAANGLDLKNAFKSIANRLNGLRVAS